jgi:hypothetical protein
MEFIGIERPVLFSSELGVTGDKNSRLVNICTRLGVSEFYEGKAGESYIDRALFENNGVHVIFQDYRHPVYSQLYGEFIPYLSIIDLLFNHGEQSLEIVTSGSDKR